MKLSLVYNLDSRPKWMNNMTTTYVADGGCRCIDFFTHGFENKINFLKSPQVEMEAVVYIDEHEKVPDEVLANMQKICDMNEVTLRLTIRPHTKERFGEKYGKHNNDLIYAETIAMAQGDYVAHFDSDMVALRSDIDMFAQYAKWLEDYDYVSMPSKDTPHCVNLNDTYWKYLDYMWVSTRFFICKKQTLPSLEETLKCFNNGHLIRKYGTSAKPNCLEHIYGVIAGLDNVFYPPPDFDNYLIASWATYYRGMFEQFNVMTYEELMPHFKNNIYGVGDIDGTNLLRIKENKNE